MSSSGVVVWFGQGWVAMCGGDVVVFWQQDLGGLRLSLVLVRSTTTLFVTAAGAGAGRPSTTCEAAGGLRSVVVSCIITAVDVWGKLFCVVDAPFIAVGRVGGEVVCVVVVFRVAVRVAQLPTNRPTDRQLEV